MTFMGLAYLIAWSHIYQFFHIFERKSLEYPSALQDFYVDFCRPKDSRIEDNIEGINKTFRCVFFGSIIIYCGNQR